MKEDIIEVVFSENAKSAIKQEKSYKNKSSRDVVCVGFGLDIGDISGEIDSKERKKEFARVFASEWFKDNDIERFFKSQREDFDKLLTAAKSGETIRVWKSSTPFSACAFAHLCNALLEIECNISVISLPEYWTTADKKTRYCTDWGEIPPGEFYKFLPFEYKQPYTEKCMQSVLWRELKTENAPLRALISGKLISVPEDFYDHLIIRNIPDQEFVMAQLIGTILRKYPLGIGDGWYALRIKKMIAENKLEIVTDKDPSHPYGKVLRKGKL